MVSEVAIPIAIIAEYSLLGWVQVLSNCHPGKEERGAEGPPTTRNLLSPVRWMYLTSDLRVASIVAPGSVAVRKLQAGPTTAAAQTNRYQLPPTDPCHPSSASSQQPPASARRRAHRCTHSPSSFLACITIKGSWAGTRAMVATTECNLSKYGHLLSRPVLDNTDSRLLRVGRLVAARRDPESQIQSILHP